MEEQIKKYLEVPPLQAKLEKKWLAAKKNKRKMMEEWVQKGDTYRVVVQNLAPFVKQNANVILTNYFEDVCLFAHYYTVAPAKRRAQPRLLLNETKEEYLDYLLSSLYARVKNVFIKGRRENKEFFKNYKNLYFILNWAVARSEKLEELKYATF